VSAEALAVGAVAGVDEGHAVDGFADPDAGSGPGRGGDPAGRAARESDWSRALAEMESIADQAEELLRTARMPGAVDDDDLDLGLTGPWHAPSGLGPLPAALAPRAVALVERQRDLVRRTSDQLGEHRRSLRSSEAMRTREAAVPVYLDAEA
jgi:hypothetical protein